ncbi:hypothetical protein [Microbacterium sp. NPDC055683]
MELIITAFIVTGIVIGVAATWVTAYVFERSEGNPAPSRAAWRLIRGRA